MDKRTTHNESEQITARHDTQLVLALSSLIYVIQRNLICIHTDPEAIHDIRVATKRVRALCRLGNHTFTRQLKIVATLTGEIAHSFSTKRDSAAKVEATAKLLKIADKTQSLALQQYKKLIFPDDNITNTDLVVMANLAKQKCYQCIKLIDDSEFDHISLSTLFKGHKKHWRKLQQMSVVKKPSTKEMHTLRKSIKNLLYQAEFFNRTNNHKKSLIIINRLKKTAEMLGDFHDLSLIKKDLSTPPISSKLGEEHTRAIQKIIDKKAKKLRNNSHNQINKILQNHKQYFAISQKHIEQ